MVVELAGLHHFKEKHTHIHTCPQQQEQKRLSEFDHISPKKTGYNPEDIGWIAG